jgi:hypothetical protein
MNTITTSFGIGNTVTLQFPTPITVRTLLADVRVKGALGFGDKVSALINGQEVSDDFTLYGGESVVVQNRACAKA